MGDAEKRKLVIRTFSKVFQRRFLGSTFNLEVGHQSYSKVAEQKKISLRHKLLALGNRICEKEGLPFIRFQWG
jgi:hypothetical protein